MKILDLPLKGKWYNMIESGEKKEEYREIKDYWISRLCDTKGLCNWGGYCIKSPKCCTDGVTTNYTHVSFRYGYTKKTMLFKLDGISIGKGNKDWGAPEEKVYILKLGDRVE